MEDGVADLTPVSDADARYARAATTPDNISTASYSTHKPSSQVQVGTPAQRE